jgi:hypothetical protein
VPVPRAHTASGGEGAAAAGQRQPRDTLAASGGGAELRQSSQPDRRRPGTAGRVVTNDEAAASPIQTSKRARGTTAHTDTVTRCQA